MRPRIDDDLVPLIRLEAVHKTASPTGYVNNVVRQAVQADRKSREEASELGRATDSPDSDAKDLDHG